jgi:hypothetical protein
LELHLYQKNYKSIAFQLGGNYQGVFSGDSINKISILSGVQIQGVSGPGSVLSLNMSWVDVLSLGILYLQPLSPGAFISARTEIKVDKETTVSGFNKKDPEENSLFLISGEIMGGVFINQQKTFKAGALFFINPQDYPDDADSRNTVLGFGALYTFNTLDYGFMPSRGIYAGLENRLCFPLPLGDPLFFDILSLDLQGILPVGGKFSIAAGAFAGLDLSSNLSRLEGLTAGFTASDRQYFPNVCSTSHYYSYKAAAYLAIQFLPAKNVFIFGNRLITSLSISAGELFNELEDVSFNSIIWNTSLNLGVRLKNNFGLLLRLGAGSNGSDSVMPFLSFDIGQMARSGIKPGY